MGIKQYFHGNGKLLLTGEYFVLDGSLALALPCRFGQSLSIIDNDQPTILWRSYDHQEHCWFEARFDLSLQLIDYSDQATAIRLQSILQFISQENPQLFSQGLQVKTQLNFPRAWGLGTSSTLLYTLAQWAKVNPYTLAFSTMGGSGYDIACAGAKSPIYYFKSNNKGYYNTIDFNPSFKSNLFFVYLNKKQNSRSGIAHYKSKVQGDQQLLQRMSQLTQEVTKAPDLKTFEGLLLEHESILANCLSLPRAQELYFSDYPGVIKSLGAWGGDFVLATSEMSAKETLSYFQQKGFETILTYDALIL